MSTGLQEIISGDEILMAFPELAEARISPRMAHFCWATLSGTPAKLAKTNAGYADSIPHQALFRDRNYAKCMNLLAKRHLHEVLGPRMLSVLAEIAEDPNAPPAARRAAASDLADRAGYLAPKHLESQDRRDLNEMTTAELQAIVEGIEGELGKRARPIDDVLDVAQLQRDDDDLSDLIE